MSDKSRGRSAPNPGRFPKGRGGNPKGRPKGSRVKTGSAFDVLVEKTLTVPVRGGGTREITAEEALQQRTLQDALEGKGMAVRAVTMWILEREAWLEKNQPEAAHLSEWLISTDPDNADAALVLLGIAAPDPARADYGDRAQLLLEPWAVQAALRRRRGGERLTDDELETVRRCTRDSDSLRWPRGTRR